MSIRILILTVRWSSRSFKLTNSHIIPEVKGCTQVDSDMHVKLFYKGCSVPLPLWFCQGQVCCLSRKNHVRKLPCIPGIVYWKNFSYILRITESCVLKKTCLLSRNREICIAIAIHIHLVIPNATRTLSVTVIVIIA